MNRWLIGDVELDTNTLIKDIIAYFNTLTASVPDPQNPSPDYPYDTSLDALFWYNKLSGRYTAPIIDGYIDNYGDNTGLTAFITNMFKSYYYDKYLKMFTIFKSKYDPLYNYNMTEHEEHKEGTSGGVYAYNSTGTSPSNTDATDGSGERDLTRAGNIGTVTTQDMIVSTLDLYDRMDIINSIYDDLIKLIALSIY